MVNTKRDCIDISADLWKAIFESSKQRYGTNEPIKQGLFATFIERKLKDINRSFLSCYASRSGCLSIEAQQQAQKQLISQLEEILEPLLEAESAAFKEHAKSANGHGHITYTSGTNGSINEQFLQLLSSQGLHTLLDSYPYIKKLTQITVRNWLENTISIIDRFMIDRSEILKASSSQITQIKASKIRIESWELGLSDSHNGHKMVAKIHLSNMTAIIYKPRDISAEDSFYKIVRYFLSLGLADQLYIPWLIPRQEYGWMECVKTLQASDTISNKEAERFGKDFGILNTVWFVLGGNDLHDENVLWTAKGPVIVDCETIFNLDLEYVNNKLSGRLHTLATDQITRSIISTGGLSLTGKDLRKNNNTFYDNAGSASLRKLLTNRPANKSSHDAINLFTHGVISGLLAYVDTLSKNNISDLEKVLIDITLTNRTKARVLIRPTSFYVALKHNIIRNFEPLRSSVKATNSIEKSILAARRPNSIYKTDAVYASELHDLSEYDIPYFYRILGSDRIINSRGDCILDTKSLDFSSLRARLKDVTDSNFIKNQIYLLKVILNPEKYKKQFTEISSYGSDKKTYQMNSYSITDYIEGLRNSPRTTLDNIVNTLNYAKKNYHEPKQSLKLQQLNDSGLFDVSFHSFDLMDGYIGLEIITSIKYLMSNAAQINNENGGLYDELLLLNPAAKADYIHIEAIKSNTPHLRSLLYAIYFLEKLSGKDAPLKPAEHEIFFKPQTQDSLDYDLLNGVPGDILSAILYHQYLDPNRLSLYRSNLVKVMKQLLYSIDDESDRKKIGLAHGPLGACLAAAALELLGLDSRDNLLRELTYAIIEKEAEIVETSRKINNNAIMSKSWCYGDAGRALVYYRVGTAFNDSLLTKRAKAMVSLDGQEKSFKNHTLCCGSLGFFSIHLQINKEEKGYRSRKFRTQLFNDFFKEPEKLLIENNSSSSHVSSSLFYGLSGLALVYMQCLDIERTPHVLEFS